MCVSHRKKRAPGIRALSPGQGLPVTGCIWPPRTPRTQRKKHWAGATAALVASLATESRQRRFYRPLSRGSGSESQGWLQAQQGRPNQYSSIFYFSFSVFSVFPVAIFNTDHHAPTQPNRPTPAARRAPASCCCAGRPRCRCSRCECPAWSRDWLRTTRRVNSAFTPFAARAPATPQPISLSVLFFLCFFSLCSRWPYSTPITKHPPSRTAPTA